MLWTRGMLRAVRPFQTHRVTPRHLETEGGCAEHACPPRQASTSLRGWEISSNHQCCMLLFHQHGRESVLGAIEIFSTHMIAISALTNYPSVNLRSPGTCTSAVQALYVLKAMFKLCVFLSAATLSSVQWHSALRNLHQRNISFG